MTGVGASEASALLGKNPWCTPLELYFRKTATIPEKQSTRFEFGRRFEPALTQWYEDRTGREVKGIQDHLSHPEAPWMMATLDGRTDDRVVETKTVDPFAAGEFGPDGSDEIPVHYFLQVQQQMACAGVELADLAAAIGFHDFRIYTIELRPEIITELIEAERDFMDRVARRDPPMPDFTHPSTADLLNMIEADSGEVAEWAGSFDDVIEYERLGKESSALDKQRKLTKGKLLHAMGTAGVANLPDGRILRRKLIEKDGYSVGPSSYYDLRILKGG
jgi:putative phage-type endonuclease